MADEALVPWRCVRILPPASSVRQMGGLPHFMDEKTESARVGH